MSWRDLPFWIGFFDGLALRPLWDKRWWREEIDGWKRISQRGLLRRIKRGDEFTPRKMDE